MKNRLSYIFLYIPLLCMALLVACSGNGNGSSDEYEELSEAHRELEILIEKPITPNPSIPKGPRNHDRIMVNNIGRFAEIFNDSNKYQYAYAEKFGIRPIEGIRDAYYTSRPLVKIQTNKFFEVDELTHSMPFLTQEAYDLLRLIGRNFIDSLNSRGADGYKIIVTSVLRTPATVKKLRRINRNATDSSCHKFATTFDISYARFKCADTTRTIDEGCLKAVLAEVLADLHSQKRCMIKYERKSPCFHITVTPGRK